MRLYDVTLTPLSLLCNPISSAAAACAKAVPSSFVLYCLIGENFSFFLFLSCYSQVSIVHLYILPFVFSIFTVFFCGEEAAGVLPFLFSTVVYLTSRVAELLSLV